MTSRSVASASCSRTLAVIMSVRTSTAIGTSEERTRP
jgi:hypothetical protein